MGPTTPADRLTDLDAALIACVILAGCLLSVGCARSDEAKGIGRKQKEFTNSIGMKMVLIPAGSFQMGSDAGRDDEKPVHSVKITRPFYMGATEVTQVQYEAAMGKNPSRFEGANRPAEQVTWHHAVEFCKKLSAREKRSYRLPTEAEWEYACRAGTTTVFCFGDSETGLGDYAWYRENSRQAKPVGQKKPNAWGLYDMHGNVFEWCQDWDGEYPSGAQVDPKGPVNGVCRVLRGGSWHGLTGFCRAAARFVNTPTARYSAYGFRALCEAAETP